MTRNSFGLSLIPMNQDTSKRLYIRLDRLGDLILSLPVDYKDKESQWMIPKGLAWAVQRSEPSRKFIEVEKDFSWRQFSSLRKWLKSEKFDEAIVFHAPWWIGLLLLLAGVKKRVTRKSQWHSYLFYNFGLRQKRSQAKLHELEYNFELRYLFDRPSYISGDKNLLEKELNQIGVSLGHSLSLKAKENPELLSSWDLIANNYIIIHPGMGGSALNWSTTKYTRLIQKLSEDNKVVITGTKTDRPYIEPIKKALGNSSRSIVWLNEKLNGLELIDVIAKAKAIVAPSTGVLHVAASTGIPTLGIFSPVQVQSYKRWGPKGLRADHIEPKVIKCPGTLSCLKEDCDQFNCMDRIEVSQIEDKLNDLIAHSN